MDWGGAITVYHGSCVVLAHPHVGGGKRHNDYGPGLYCTEGIDLAREWACADIGGGYANRYSLDTGGLEKLDLADRGVSVLAWLALLMKNRWFAPASPMEERGIRYLLETFAPDTSQADVVYGWRADDSYFSFARAFVRNTISVAQLERAMRLGNLKEQVFIKSKRALDHLAFEGAERVDGSTWYPRRMQRDAQARSAFKSMASEDDLEGVFLRDMIRKGLDPDDALL